MKKTILLVCFFVSTGATLWAQRSNSDQLEKDLQTENKDTTAWLHSGVFDLGINQGFEHNWAAGGELASLTINGIFSGSLTHLHGRTVWSNNLDLAYGLFYAYSNDFVPRKTNDRIDFTSKYGYRVDTTKNFYFTGLFNFKSQFTKGYNYSLTNFDSASTSKFMSPGYFTLAAGGEYRKGTDISLFLSPLAARVVTASTYYTDMTPQGAFGVAYGKTSVFQLGAYFSGRYVININKKMTFRTRLDLYSNYLAHNIKDSSGAVVRKDNPGNISWLWDNVYSYKISKYISLTLAATFIYDNDIPYVKPVGETEPGENIGWLQLNEALTIGVEYKF